MKKSSVLAHQIGDVSAAICQGRPQELEAFIEGGGDINARDEFGRTLLMKAVMSANITAVDLLLKHGAKRGLKDNTGLTAMNYAVISRDQEAAAAIRNQKKPRSGAVFKTASL